MLDILFNLLRRKNHHAPADPGARNSKQAMLQKLNSELRDFRTSVTDKNIKQKTSEFYALTRKALKEILAIQYEATFQEIVEELEK